MLKRNAVLWDVFIITSIGLIQGMISGTIISDIMISNIGFNPLLPMVPTVPIEFIRIVFLMFFSIGTISALIPAYQAYNIEVTESIRSSE